MIPIVLILTFLIHLILTSAHAVPLTAVRTKRITTSFALFNLVLLVSRTAVSLQSPLLAKWIERHMRLGLNVDTGVFRLIILMSTLGTLVGAFLIPSFQRLLAKAVMKFHIKKSISKLIYFGLTKSSFEQWRAQISLPGSDNFKVSSYAMNDFPYKIFFLSMIMNALIATGILSSLYAGFIDPSVRATSSTLVAVVNGGAVIIFMIFIDPYISLLTDGVVNDNVPESTFRKTIRILVVSRVLGTVLAQFLFVPFAYLITNIANWI
ncbi:MAG: lipid II flippase family protein [Bacteroidia bacterium]